MCVICISIFVYTNLNKCNFINLSSYGITTKSFYIIYQDIHSVIIPLSTIDSSSGLGAHQFDINHHKMRAFITKYQLPKIIIIDSKNTKFIHYIG